jgi:hypothetical protein
MKVEYNEGTKAKENFENAMKAAFQAPRPVKQGKKQKDTPSTSFRKPKKSDKD